ncbi:MAG: hypothetical protein JSS71_05935, partial [Armatimonadetes bacterium]|nr:hypothetical protein [Armatimonadota bacterium]
MTFGYGFNNANITYDATGRRTAVTSGSGAETTTYDATGNPLTRVGPGARATYTYDEVGNPKSLRTLDGYVRTYVYDAVDRLTEQN